VTFGLQVNCHCCTVVYQIRTQLVEAAKGILCYLQSKMQKKHEWKEETWS